MTSIHHNLSQVRTGILNRRPVLVKSDKGILHNLFDHRIRSGEQVSEPNHRWPHIAVKLSKTVQPAKRPDVGEVLNDDVIHGS